MVTSTQNTLHKFRKWYALTGGLGTLRNIVAYSFVALCVPLYTLFALGLAIAIYNNLAEIIQGLLAIILPVAFLLLGLWSFTTVFPPKESR